MAGFKAAPDATKMTSTPASGKAQKRKRDVENTVTSTPTPSKKFKKRDSQYLDEGSAKKRSKLKDRLQGDNSPASTPKESAVSTKRSKTPATNSGDRDDKARKKSKDGKRKSSGKNTESIDETASVSSEPPSANIAEVTAEEKSMKNKHAGLLSKFERTKTAAASKAKKAKVEVTEPQEETAEAVFAKGLEPLPQPENPEEPETLPTYSSLPEWLANPRRTSTKERAKFSDLGIKPDLLHILDERGYKEAFAVQSAVIPLLLDNSNNYHPGDVCVSAATGSGKTLSYVLPLVSSLKALPASRLRGLIVVPTRELVRQARESCELLASRSGLRIGSAVGNVAIKDEQKLLMRVDQVYDPATVAQRQNPGLRGDDWIDFDLEACVNEAVNTNEYLPDHTQRSEPNVDILICTPGRLVDHIRYTKGFTLKYLDWLVIDEADRLLNESFQDWVDVVMGSLDSRQAPETFGPCGKFLHDMKLSIAARPPRKVILSATMTRDISKLNSLRLTNPKMVVVGAEITSEATDIPADRLDASYDLPPTLNEYMVPVAEGAHKPLYLLHLLESQIKIAAASTTDDAGSDTSEDSDDTSSDEESSDSNSSDSDSSDDSDSDSELESDSDTDSDSDSSSDSSSDSEEEVDSPAKSATPRSTVLVFTKSSESASRLARLITLTKPSLAKQIGVIVKSNKSSASRKTLSAYRRGRISIIIATDRASRGLDLESLTHVVNYDVPHSITTYVHRVGRTARAGRSGSAWTLVAHHEGRWFSTQIVNSLDGQITRSNSIDRVNVKVDKTSATFKGYGAALEKLEKEVKMGGATKSKSKSE
ncbi:Helicase C-terminal [Penicillium sp. IBT 18751x]|nr:Helicase C-terminal [Penicillium sp. IBT 18751x]